MDHLQIRLGSRWSTLPHPLISSLMGVFGKCFNNTDFWLSPFLSLCTCRQNTVITLKCGGIHRGNFDIYVAPELEGKCKIPHFSSLIENVHPDSKATSPRNTSIWCTIYESIRSFQELIIKAGGKVVYFAPMVRFTPPSLSVSASRGPVFRRYLSNSRIDQDENWAQEVRDLIFTQTLF